ncbi:MAG: hypothetical protein K2N51_12145 [Lachnospiraceae bacterium]|nr:hypothetical protein [Lachnospiraceae bacterium]
MTYIKVSWKHDFPDESILIFSELDNNQNEIRKVEVYRGNWWRYACEYGNKNGTSLSECELPELSVINEDIQFEGVEIEKDEFEKVWKRALGER